MRKKDTALSMSAPRRIEAAIVCELLSHADQLVTEDNAHTVTDTHLVMAAKHGNNLAFDELSRRYAKRIERHAYRILRNREDAEDAVQDSLLKAFRSIGEFRSDSSFSTWLTRIVINSALMLLRKRRSHPEILYGETTGLATIPEIREPHDPSPDPELLCATRELRESLESALLRLPCCLRSATELFHAEGCSMNEVAETLGVSVAAVKSRLMRARRVLRVTLPEPHVTDRRRATRILALVFLSLGFLLKPTLASSQIGSGSPDASSRVQVQVQDATPQEPPTRPQTKTFPGQALDQDAAVLATVPPDPLLKRDLFHPVLGPVDAVMNDLRKAEQLSFAATYTVLNQYATKAPDGVRHNWGTGRFDLSGGWKAYDHGGTAGTFSMLVRSGVNLGVSQQFNLSDSLGSGLVLNCLPGGGPQEPITLNVLYYRQDFYQKKMAFYIGKIHPNEFISLSLYNNDERSQFLNAVNDGNLTVPSDGTYAGGAAFEYQVTQHIYIHAVTVDTEGAQQRNLKTLVDKKYMNAIELGWKDGAPSQQEHLFRLLVWRDDTATQGSGAGIGFGSDYELKSGWVPFGRLGIATDTGSSIKRVLDTGVVHIRPFGRRGDMFGASITLSDPSHSAKHHESLFETFYRVRMTQSLELGPDLEVSVHPTNNAKQYTTALLGIRMRIIF